MVIQDQERKEECRLEVRRYLAERPALAFAATTIHRSLYREFDFTLQEVIDGLVFWVSAKQAQITPCEAGATEYFQITAAGTLAHERRH